MKLFRTALSAAAAVAAEYSKADAGLNIWQDVCQWLAPQ